MSPLKDIVQILGRFQMRSQLVNWFLLALSISDLCVLGSSFFVFSAPVIVELLQHEELVALSARLLVFFYPIAHTTHTLSVYLTILVSVHRYFGVCHPFMVSSEALREGEYAAIFRR